MYFWLIVIASAIWVYFDAKKIGVRKGLVPGFFNLGAGGWCAVTLLLWIIGLPAYLFKRGSLRRAAASEAGSRATVAPSSSGTHADALASLEKLASLRDSGVLTEVEFNQKKREILAN